MVSLQARSLGQALLRCHYVLFPVPPGLSVNRSLPVGPLSPEALVTFISGKEYSIKITWMTFGFSLG